MLQEKTVKVSDLGSVFGEKIIGTRVTNPDAFLSILHEAIALHTPSLEDVEGEWVITLPSSAHEHLSGAVGRRSLVREHYHRISLTSVHDSYLDRRYAHPVTRCDAVVYTKDAYLRYLEVYMDEEGSEECWKAVVGTDCTHILLEVVTYCDGYPLPPYPPEIAKALALEQVNIVQNWEQDALAELSPDDAVGLAMEWDLVADREEELSSE